jgi:hypothetical protein
MKFEIKKLQEDCPVMIAKIPDLIMKEIDVWVDESKKIKDHPLAELKAVENAGYVAAAAGIKHNSYQTSVPYNLIQQSFWLPWIIRLANKIFESKNFQLLSSVGHYDFYDLWTNFSYKGDDNPTHIHRGDLSGVIYYKNHDHPTYFDDYDIKYDGYDGTMVLFPSHVRHHVKEQLRDEERITIAFNMIGDFFLKNTKSDNIPNLQYQ